MRDHSTTSNLAQTSRINIFKTVRQKLYEENKQFMRLHIQKDRDIKQTINQHKQSAQLVLKYNIVLPLEEDLPEFQAHHSSQYYLPLRHQIYLPSAFESLFPAWSPNGIRIRQEIVEDCIKLLSQAENQTERRLILQYIRQKYICPLDLIQRIEICSQFMADSTVMIETLMLIFCRHISPTVFVDSILSARKYICPSTQTSNKGSTLALGEVYRDRLCRYCSIYSCIKHKPLRSKANSEDKQAKILKEVIQREETTSYFILQDELKQIVRDNLIAQFRPTCSPNCYRLMDKDLLLHKYSKFQLPSVEVIQQIKMARQMYGNLPCKISSLLNINCADLSLYLLVARKPAPLANYLGMSEIEYLKTLGKESVQNYSISCRCRKGFCRADKCPCFRNNRECDRQLCHRCFTESAFIGQTCRNKEVVLGRIPSLKIGPSILQDRSLGLFTLQPIAEGSIVCWTSGEILSQKQQILRRYCTSDVSSIQTVRSERRGIPAFKGKYQFIRRTNSSQANLKITFRQVDGQRYLCFEAVRDIHADEELSAFQP